MAKKVERTRNNNEWTESRYWQHVRSALRRGFRYWKPIVLAKNAARRACDKGRQKWEYQCNICKEWFKGTDVQVDHLVRVGSLKCPEDLPGFLERLTAEEGYQVVCKDCHQKKTNEEREKRK